MGKESHDINSGLSWFLTVVWPFAVGWLAVALAVGLYRRAPGWSRAAAATWLGGVALGLLLRVVVTQRAAPAAFMVVALLFIGAATVGWRLVWMWLAPRWRAQAITAGEA